MIDIRPWQNTDSIPELTRLMNDAYAPLLQAGLNFTAATQDDRITKERAEGGYTLAAWEGGDLLGAITLHEDRDTLLYRQPGVLVIGPFAVASSHQARGIGSRLLHAVEEYAHHQNLNAIALDTAEPANHLRSYYEAKGYRLVGYVDWRDKAYRSILMAKWLRGPSIRPCHESDADQALAVVRTVFEAYGFTWDGSDYFADLTGLPHTYPDGFWVSEHDGHIEGIGGLERHKRFEGEPGTLVIDEGQMRVAGTDGELVRMYVLPSARKKGIGTGIGECILSEARHLGLTALEIWSDKQFVDAHRLYERLGAIRVGERVCDDPDESPEWGFYLPL